MNPIVEKVYQIGIIPVIAFNSVDEALPLCKALAEGGLQARDRQGRHYDARYRFCRRDAAGYEHGLRGPEVLPR